MKLAASSFNPVPLISSTIDPEYQKVAKDNYLNDALALAEGWMFSAKGDNLQSKCLY